MAEVFFTLFLFIAITAVTAVLFGGWVIYTVVCTVGRGIAGMSGACNKKRAFAMNRGSMRTCNNVHCRTRNPADAKFCRRCGQHLPESRRVAVRRAAMW